MQEIFRNSNGITIKELKEYVKNLPEIDEDTGEDAKILLVNVYGGLGECKTLVKLKSNNLYMEST